MKESKIIGEELFYGKQMTKAEYLALEHLDDKKETKENVKKSYRLLNEDMITFLGDMGKTNRTLLPIMNFVGDIKVGSEAVELIL